MALDAWKAVRSIDLGNMTAKQALACWVKENANNYGQEGDNFQHNKNAQEESVKVANWQPEGGRPPKTK